jgi:hypothetical protein
MWRLGRGRFSMVAETVYTSTAENARKQLLDGLVSSEEVKQALRRVVAEEHLLHPVRLRSFGGAARKEVRLIRKERRFHVFRVRLMDSSYSALSKAQARHEAAVSERNGRLNRHSIRVTFSFLFPFFSERQRLSSPIPRR